MNLLDELHEAVVTGDDTRAVELTRQGLDEGYEPHALIDDAMVPAMAEAGRRFEAEEFFVPELLVAGRAIQAGLEILRPLLAPGTAHRAGRVVIGTVQGDLHDIGKNLVAVMFEGAGFDIVDLGTDVAPAEVVAAIEEHRPDVVALSALLTTTMLAMPATIEAIEAAGHRDQVTVMVGGAPLNERRAEEFGADGYAENANAAVRLAVELVGGASRAVGAMTAALIEDLVARGPVLTDGAWGTRFHSLGLAPGQQPDLWNLSHPDQVEAVARSYVEAGSQVILTNTFQANRFALRDSAADVAAVNRAGAELSRRAARGQALVFASMGPTNTMLVAGDVDEDELRDAFAEQATALAEGGADAIVIETMSDVVEAVVALDAARTTGLPVVVCMTFDTGRNRDRTMTGVTPAQAAEALAAAGADVVGANCGSGIDAAAPICEALTGATELPVWIKANAGMPELVGREVVYEMSAERFADHADELRAAGADFIGGCCGTTPEFVAAMARRWS